VQSTAGHTPRFSRKGVLCAVLLLGSLAHLVFWYQSHDLIVEISNFGLLEVGFCFNGCMFGSLSIEETICMSCIEFFLLSYFFRFLHMSLFLVNVPPSSPWLQGSLGLAISEAGLVGGWPLDYVRRCRWQALAPWIPWIR